MLLSSPAFSTFLNDLSGTGAPASIPEVVRSQSQTPSRPRSTLPRKDISPNQAAPRDVPPHSQNNTHVEMTMIPEEVTLEIINAAETVNNGWTNSVDLGGLYDAQVYALTTVPQGPDIDTINFAMLHDKTSNSVGPYPSDVLKDEPAEIESLPALAKNSQAPDVVKRPTPDADVDVSDPTFALFINRLPTFATPAVGESDDCMFGDIESEKAVGSVELGVNDQNIEGGQVCPATLKKFARLCLRLDEASARIAAVTSHL